VPRKITKHNATPVEKFMSPTRRFEYIHTDLVGPLPVSSSRVLFNNNKSRWPETIPIADITASRKKSSKSGLHALELQ